MRRWISTQIRRPGPYVAIQAYTNVDDKLSSLL